MAPESNSSNTYSQDASFLSGASCSFIDKAEFDLAAAPRFEQEAARKSENSFRLVLASRSPRRRSLLESAGYRFAVLPSEDGVEEQAERGELRDADPVSFVATLAYLKARNVVERLTAEESDARREIASQLTDVDELTPIVVVSCDSVAVCGGEILGKPDDRADAERMLRKLSGSKHAVHTGLTVWKIAPGDDLPVRRVETSILQMEPLSDERLFAYLESGLWEGKAGAFGYQDGNDWLKLLEGTASNVVGLPMEALAFVLTQIVS